MFQIDVEVGTVAMLLFLSQLAVIPKLWSLFVPGASSNVCVPRVFVRLELPKEKEIKTIKVNQNEVTAKVQRMYNGADGLSFARYCEMSAS